MYLFELVKLILYYYVFVCVLMYKFNINQMGKSKRQHNKKHNVIKEEMTDNESVIDDNGSITETSLDHLILRNEEPVFDSKFLNINDEGVLGGPKTNKELGNGKKIPLNRIVKNNVHITLVDRNNYHYEATDLHEAAAGTQSASRITYPISDVINPQITTFIQDEVVKIDPDKKTVKLAGHEELLHYDYCVLGLGFVSETFGIPGAEENALPMTNVKEALAIYDHIIAKMKDYRTTHNPDDLQIVICGGGFTGIELAGALVDARPRYAQIAGVKPEDIQISLILFSLMRIR